MRAGYGEKLRGFFARNTNPVRLIDFGSQKIFESATVDVNILLFTKESNTGNTMACTVKENCTSNLNDFYKQKIVWGNLCLSAQFSLVEDEYFINAPSPMIVPGSKYLLAILNSKVADWYIRQLGVTRNGGYFEYKPMFVEQLPVPYINEHQQKLFDEIVDKIHQLKQQGDDTSTLEEDIDNMVFQLYEFTPDEIAYIRSTVL